MENGSHKSLRSSILPLHLTVDLSIHKVACRLKIHE
jgi:hypothetical protein